MDKYQQQLNDQTMKMNQNLSGRGGGNLSPARIPSDPPAAVNEAASKMGNGQNLGMKNPQLSSQGLNPPTMQGQKLGSFPNEGLDKKVSKMTTPERQQLGGANPQFMDSQMDQAQKMRANVGSADPQRNMTRAQPMGGDVRLSIKSDSQGGAGMQTSIDKKSPKDAFGNITKPGISSQQMQNMDPGGPPTYRSMGEEDDLIPGTGVNMPQMNLGNQKFNQGGFPGKDPKFNAPNVDSKNLKLGEQIQGPNIKGGLNFEQKKESSQIFGIKSSGKKKNVPNMDMPPSALLDDESDHNYGIEMGRMSSDNQRFKGKMKDGDLNYAGSLIGSVPDEKQKLISIESPQLRNPQSKTKQMPDPGQFSPESSVTRASIIKNKLNPRSMVPQKDSSNRNDDQEDFAYEFIGRGQDTIVSSDIKKYIAPTKKDDGGKSFLPANAMRQGAPAQQAPRYKKTEAVMNPLNDALHFHEPRDRESLDSSIFDFYAKNSFVRYIDGDEDPLTLDQKIHEQKNPARTDLNYTTIKDVRNIHISSDHQRAYVWAITTKREVGSQVMMETQRELWLQVYSLSANWSSHSTLSQDQNQKMQMLNSLRLEVDGLQRQLEIATKEKNKKEAQKIKELLKSKKTLLAQFEMEIYKELDLFNPMQKPDVDQESQCFHLIEHYQSVNNNNASQTTERGDHVKATKYFQQPQQSEFSIHIGTFEEPKIDYLSDPIQSFYKQFVSSEEGIYFFKYEDKKEKLLQDQLVPSSKINNFGGSQPQNAPFSAAISATSGKTGVDSQSDGFSSPSLTPDGMPVLYKLSPYECKAERVIINGSSIRLPFDSQSNQFAIVRAMDPQLSRELSSIDNLMFAILKEVHLKQDELTDDNTSSQINRRMSSKNKRNQLQPKIIESRIEIYKANQTVTTFGCNIDLKEVPAKLDPKNLSIAHRLDQDDDDSYKPVKKDFNFCCWYLIDQVNQSLNVAILLNEQMINMRTPYEYDSDRVSIEDFNKRLVVAKNQRLKIDDIDEVPFLQDYKISQNMPIYAIDLKEPTNFAKVPCFLKAANDAKKVWDRELLQNESENSKRFPPEKMLSPLQPQHQLQNLYEFQEQVFLNFDVPLERIYIVLRQRPNDIDFEVLYPIIPDYLWASEDGLKIREEIDQTILHTYKKYLPEEPTQKSYKIEGINKMLYSEQYNQAFQNRGDHEKVKQYSRESTSMQYTNRSGQAPRKRWTKESVRQCVSFHQIFLKKINDSSEGREGNVALSQMSPLIFAEETLHQYGLAHFQCTWEAMKSIVNQKSLKLAKTAQFSVLVDDYDEQEQMPGSKAPKSKNKNKKTLRGKPQGMSQKIEELAQEIKSPRSSKSDALQSPRALSKPRTILVSGGLMEPKDNAGLKVKFQLEKMCFCEGLRNFIHVIKYKKKHFVKRNNIGEVIKIYYKNNYYAFEDDFEFFDYEIVIGQLDVSQRQHCINLNEERDAMKRTQQILAQYEHYDGIFTPLQNPYTPYQQLVMTYDIEPMKEEQRQFNNQNGKLTQKEPVQIMQICQRQTTNIVADADNEDLCQMKNLPAEFSFQEFLHNDMFRKEYFEAQLLQVSQIRRVFWQREDPDSYPLIDYMNEQSMAKVWTKSKSSDYNQLFNIKSVDILDVIARDKNAKFTPRAQVILDSRLEAMPQNYSILRNLLMDDMTVTTVKQSKSNPKNVIFAIRQKREMSMPQEINQNGTVTEKQMCLHLIGQLDESFQNLKSLYIIRQQYQQAFAQKEYKRREKPLEQSTNVLEIQSFNSFAYQFAEQNSKLSILNPLYGKLFDDSYKNCRMMAFDTNYGDSIDQNVEIFAVKTWKPLNAVKIFTINFDVFQLQEIYEIPIDGNHLDQLQDIQIVRISDIKKTFALLLDWCSIKEIYLIDFKTVPIKVQKRHPPQNRFIGSLIGKYDFICPNMTESSYFSGDEKIFVPNLQIKLVPLYKKFDPNDEIGANFIEQQQELTRDGFSLIYDQGRVDFDYMFFSNIVGLGRIQLHLQYASSVFEYEHKLTEKVKRNLNKECEVDCKFFQALIIKVRLRKQILDSEIYTENEKLNLLRYFSKALQGHRNLDYGLINEKISRIGIRVDIFKNQDFNFFMHPRTELFGANLVTFLNDDQSFVKRVLERWFQATKQSKHNMVDIYKQSLVFPYLPSISGNKYQFQKYQYDYFCTKPRFCELDMNLMSPIGWTLFHKCYNTAKIYTDYFKKFAKIQTKEVIGNHSVIFYSSIKQLLQLGSVDLSEFLDPDGVGEDIGCELFQQTLRYSYLPQFELTNQTFSNEYRRSIHTLERNMQQALQIDEIQSPKKAFKEDEEYHDAMTTYEVQYGLIDLQWVNVLNIFDQSPINRCYKRQRSIEKNKKGHEFDWIAEIKRHQQLITPLISHISFENCKDIYKFQSIKLLIDHYWSYQSYDFFKTQFMIYFVFFVLPFSVDVYYLMMVTIPQGDLMAVQILFSLVAFICQFIFFMSEIIQMMSAGKSLLQYFTDPWNINDFLCLPLYLSALIITWKYEEEIDDSDNQLVAIKVLYTIVICQTFIKLLFFSRIFDSVTFTLLLLRQIVYDLQGLLIFALLANIIVAAFYIIYEARLTSQYFYVLLMDVLFLSIGISSIGQSYEQVLGDAEAWLNHQKAELIVECQQILLRLGYIKPHDIQNTILIRKKKFADDISERLNQEQWSGLTQSLKMYLQFNIRGQFDEYRESAEAQSEQVNAQLAQITKCLSEVQKSIGDGSSRHSTRRTIDIDADPNDIDISKSKITYEPSLNNISH